MGALGKIGGGRAKWFVYKANGDDVRRSGDGDGDEKGQTKGRWEKGPVA
jgi:hypothetical protein